jgi:hypothetical protein
MSDEIPKGWATAPLDSLCQKFRGVSYGRDEASSVPKKVCVPILRANNLQNERLIFDKPAVALLERIRTDRPAAIGGKSQRKEN